MDKRYFLMLLIVIICCINLSIIVNNSDIIGSASVSAGNYLFSAPDGFTLYENNGNSAVIRNNNMSIYFESDLSDSDNFNKRLDYIKNETNDTILSTGTISIENISVNTVYYKIHDNDNNAVFYFEKDNTTFKIIVSNFNYNTERDLTLEYVTFIIQSTHLNYKSD